MIVWSFDSQLQLNCQQVYCSHETSFHFWMNRWKDIIRLRYRSMKSVKIKINETSVSSISTDWSIQSISIKSVFPIFIDSSIDKSIPIFIDCHAISFMSYDVGDSERFPISQEGMLFIFTPRTNFRRTSNGSQELNVVGVVSLTGCKQ